MADNPHKQVRALIAAEFALRYPRTPAVPFTFGLKRLADGGAPPRIVWIPGRVRYDAPQKTTKNPRSLYTEVAAFDAHVWAANEDDAWDMRRALVVSARRKLSDFSFTLVDADWPALDESWEHFGVLTVVRFEFKVPVLDVGKAIVVLKGWESEAGTPGDGVLQCGE